MNDLPTMSKLGLAGACVYPWSPHAPDAPEQEPTEAANNGTDVHRLAERIARREVFEPPPEHREVHEALTANLRGIENLEPEVMLAYDVERDSARRLSPKHARDYSDLREGELGGTADLIILDGTTLIVRDWKTGQAVRGSRPVDLMQLKALGLAAARFYGFSEVTIEIGFIDGGTIWTSVDKLDAIDLDAIAGEVRAIWKRLHGPPSPPTPGRHCASEYCPIVRECPATTKALTEVSHGSTFAMPMNVAIQSPEHAASVYTRLEMVDEACKSIRRVLKMYVEELPEKRIEIAPGVHWGVVQKKGDESVRLTPEVEQLLEQEGASAAIERKVTKAALERIATELGKPKQTLVKAVRAIGGIVEGGTYDSFGEIKPRKASAK